MPTSRPFNDLPRKAAGDTEKGLFQLVKDWEIVLGQSQTVNEIQFCKGHIAGLKRAIRLVRRTEAQHGNDS